VTGVGVVIPVVCWMRLPVTVTSRTSSVVVAASWARTWPALVVRMAATVTRTRERVVVTGDLPFFIVGKP
jgi:hypothetical protein